MRHSGSARLFGTALALLTGWLGCTTSGTGDVSSPATPDAQPDPVSDAGSSPDTGAVPAPDAASSGDGAVTNSPACKTYCNIVMTSCSGDYPQFGSMAACLNGCAFYPPGLDSDPTNEGNTLKCRTTHATSAEGHCFHGGPYGYGGCGSMCQGFCQIAMGWCPASKTGAPFASLAACTTECEAWGWAPQGPDGAASYRPNTPATGDTLECREVMLQRSLANAADRDTYCPLAGTNSAACK